MHGQANHWEILVYYYVIAYINDDEPALLDYYNTISETFKIKFIAINVEERDSEFICSSHVFTLTSSILIQPQPQSLLPGHRNLIFQISSESTRQLDHSIL